MKKNMFSRRNGLILGVVSVFASAALILSGCAGAAGAQGPQGPAGPQGAPGSGVSAEQVANGQKLYTANCVVCHGADAAGGIAVGTENSTNIQLRGSRGFRYGYQPFLLVLAILDGRDQKGADLGSAMPRWRGKLSEQDAYDIVSYLFTVPLTPSAGQPMPTSFK